MRIISKRFGFKVDDGDSGFIGVKSMSTDPDQRFIKRVHNAGGVIICPSLSTDPGQR